MTAETLTFYGVMVTAFLSLVGTVISANARSHARKANNAVNNRADAVGSKTLYEMTRTNTDRIAKMSVDIGVLLQWRTDVDRRLRDLEKLARDKLNED